jgi:hypothetical protein
LKKKRAKERKALSSEYERKSTAATRQKQQQHEIRGKGKKSLLH